MRFLQTGVSQHHWTGLDHHSPEREIELPQCERFSTVLVKAKLPQAKVSEQPFSREHLLACLAPSRPLGTHSPKMPHSSPTAAYTMLWRTETNQLRPSNITEAQECVSTEASFFGKKIQHHKPVFGGLRAEITISCPIDMRSWSVPLGLRHFSWCGPLLVPRPFFVKPGFAVSHSFATVLTWSCSCFGWHCRCHSQISTVRVCRLTQPWQPRLAWHVRVRA